MDRHYKSKNCEWLEPSLRRCSEINMVKTMAGWDPEAFWSSRSDLRANLQEGANFIFCHISQMSSLRKYWSDRSALSIHPANRESRKKVKNSRCVPTPFPVGSLEVVMVIISKSTPKEYIWNISEMLSAIRRYRQIYFPIFSEKQ
jgi:hypothetical protein